MPLVLRPVFTPRVRLRLLVALAIAIPSASLPLYARDVFVDNRHAAASDTNPGTADLPWATIARATRDAMPGDRIVVAAGIYRETVKFARSGLAEQLIELVAADPTNRPVIDGADPIEGWVEQGDGSYRAEVASAPGRLFQDGRIMAIAMAPDATDPVDPYNHSNWMEIAEADLVEAGSPEEAALTAAGFETLVLAPEFASVRGEPVADDFWVGASIYHYNNFQNRTLVRPILAYDAASRRATVALSSNDLASRFLPPEGTRADCYAVANHPAVVDVPGEYAVQGNSVFIRPFGDVLTEIAGSARATGIDLDRAHIVVDGFEIRNHTGSGITDTYRAAADDFTLRNCRVHHNAGSGFASRNSLGCRIENSEFSYNNRNGISFGSDTGHIAIIGNHVHHNNDNGIWLGSGGGKLYYCSDVLIRGNRVEFQGSSQSHPDNIQFQQVSDMVIEDNHLEQAGHQNMWCQANGRITFRRNTFINGPIGFCHMSPVYIYNNLFYQSGLRFDAHQGTLGDWRVSLGNLGIYWNSWPRLTAAIQGDIGSFPQNLLWTAEASIIQDIRNLPVGQTLADQDDAFRQRLVDHINAIIGDRTFYRDHPGLRAALSDEGAAAHIVDAVIRRGLMDAAGNVKTDLTPGEEEEILGVNRVIVEELVLRPEIEPSYLNYRERVAVLANNIVVNSPIAPPPAALELAPYFRFDHNYLNVANSYQFSSWESMGALEPNSISSHDNAGLSSEFVAPATLDFSLRSDGLLVDAGVDVGLVYAGLAPDVGPTESPYLGAPCLHGVSGEADSIDVDWIYRFAGLVDHFTVWRAETAEGPWTPVADPVVGTSWTDALVFTDRPYFYAVSATAAGLASSRSAARRGRAGGGTGTEDFEDADLQRTAPALSNGLTWDLRSGAATLASGTYFDEGGTSRYLRLGVNQSGPSSLVATTTTGNSCELEFDLVQQYVVGDQGVYLLFVDDVNHYRVAINRDGLRLVRVLGGVETVVGTDSTLGTQHALSTAHYRIRVQPIEGGLSFSFEKSNWVRRNDPANPVVVDTVFSVVWTDLFPEAETTFASGAIGLFQNVTGTYNVAQYDNIVLQEIPAGTLTFADWMEVHAPGGTGGLWDPFGDIDGDGVVNLVEYACSTDPFVPDALPLDPEHPTVAGLPTLAIGAQGAPDFFYRWRRDPSLAYRITEYDEASGSWVPVRGALGARIANGDDTELRRVVVEGAGDPARRVGLYRVEIDYAP